MRCSGHEGDPKHYEKTFVPTDMVGFLLKRLCLYVVLIVPKDFAYHEMIAT